MVELLHESPALVPPAKAVDVAEFDTRIHDATTALAELSSQYQRFLPDNAGQKMVVKCYTQRHLIDTSELLDAIYELRDSPLSVQMLKQLYEFVEQHGGLDTQENIQIAMHKNLSFPDKILSITQQTGATADQQLAIIVLHEQLANIAVAQAKEFEWSLLQKRDSQEIANYLTAIQQRLESNTISVTKEIRTNANITPEIEESEAKLSLKQRLKFTRFNDGQLMLNINLLDNKETLSIFTAEAAMQPMRIQQKGNLHIRIPDQSLIKFQTATETALFQVSGIAEPTPIASSKNDADLDGVILLAFDKIWQWHRREFEHVDPEIILQLNTTLLELPKRENTGKIKSALREQLAALESKGFSTKSRIEIMDRVEGLNGRGMVLDQSLFALLEKNNRLSWEQWDYILANGRDKAALIHFFTGSGLLDSQGINLHPILTPFEKKLFAEKISEAIPADNIANMVRLFADGVPNVPELEAALRDFCYGAAAERRHQQIPFEIFQKSVTRFLEKSSLSSEEITAILANQDMTLRWLHAKVTKNFSGLAAENVKRVTALSIHDKVTISGAEAPRLRYDIEQKALILKASLAEILPHELHQYLQLRTQQGSFDREYCLNIEKIKNRELLESLLLVETNNSDLKQGYLSAEKVERVLYRYHLSTHVRDAENTMAATTLQLAARQLAEDIINNPQIDIVKFIKEEILKTTNFKEYEKNLTTTSIFNDAAQLEKLCIAIIHTPAQNAQPESQRFQKLLTTILWKTATKLATTQDEHSPVLTPGSSTGDILNAIFSQATITAEGFHGWGANDETIVPIVRTLSRAQEDPTLVVANNTMGASKSNLLNIRGIDPPLSFCGRGQDMKDYGKQLFALLCELDGVAFNSGMVFGHSMGGYEVLQTALDHAEEWIQTVFIALEPVLAKSDDIYGEYKHYISLLGASTGEVDRATVDKIAAIITKLVTTPDDLPALMQDIMVYFGQIKINEKVYSQLVKNSDPRVARAHSVELIQNRKDFHTNVTPILLENEGLSTAEKIYMAERLLQQVKIVIAQNDDVLKHQIALGKLLDDPEVPEENRAILADMVITLFGNHYGHLERTVYKSDDNPEMLTNQRRVARAMRLLRDANNQHQA